MKKEEAAAVVDDSICVVAGLLKAIWENGRKLGPFHPLLREWSRDRMMGADVTIPYHPAAVRFYREHGAWNAETDQTQQRLLKAGR